MTINEHLDWFCGKVVAEYEEGVKLNPKDDAVRLSLSYDEFNDDGLYWEDKLDQLLANPKVGELEALVIGPWEEVGSQDSEFIVELLVANKDKLKGLRAIFFGDITMEESECSWIDHGDMSPLWAAFPKLTHFAVRGCGGLSLGELHHPELQSLVVQCGGLSPSVLNQVIRARLPKLQHLELWLGDEGYGAEFALSDLDPLMNDNLFPNLVYLGLKNSERQDDVAKMLVESSVLDRIKVLDMSLGTLSDEGAAALITSPKVKKLKMLDLHHHYLSEDMMKRMKALGIEVDISQPQSDYVSDGEVSRFVAVSE